MSEWKGDDPFELLVLEPETGGVQELAGREIASIPSPAPSSSGVATARLHGFDLDERPLLVGLPGIPHELVGARTTVPLLRQNTGASVVVVFEGGDVRQPIVLGLLQHSRAASPAAAVPAALVSAQVDDQRIVLSAEREITLQCGEASITLTRAGKVLIKGTYVLSRSSGYNKIKGAAVDIN
jgi:hypothetical protein